MQEIKVPTLMEVVNERLRDMITSGDLLPGEKVNVDALSRKFKSSPTPIREALGRLEQEGLVNRIPRIGWQVAKLSRDEFAFLHDYQEVLEQAICERLVGVSDEIDFSNARSINEEMSRFAKEEQFDLILKKNEEFHLFLYEYCANKILLDALKHVWNNLRWQRRVMIKSKDYLDRYYGEHLEIIEALESKDKRRVKKALESHFKTGYLSLEKSFKEK